MIPKGNTKEIFVITHNNKRQGKSELPSMLECFTDSLWIHRSRSYKLSYHGENAPLKLRRFSYSGKNWTVKIKSFSALNECLERSRYRIHKKEGWYRERWKEEQQGWEGHSNEGMKERLFGEFLSFDFYYFDTPYLKRSQ
jgi:hypothetical protein